MCVVDMMGNQWNRTLHNTMPTSRINNGEFMLG